mmetsp:Transcript_89422/g.252342  ORF Transcript_89422/g.252342 Transcript_89422/m.252342 type:complete len:401 (+) Transcript_89422:130-1332(+)
MQEDVQAGPVQGPLSESHKQEVRGTLGQQEADLEGCSRKRKISIAPDAPSSDVNSRCRLHDACVSILNRELEAGDLVYDIREAVAGQAVVELRLAGLPGAWAVRRFAGEPHATRRLARESAAQAALSALLADPETAALIDAPPPLEGRGRAEEPLSRSGQNEQGLGQGSSAVSSSSSSTAPRVLAGKGTAVDAKSQVVVFCQRSCGRNMRREDLVYTLERLDGQFVASLRLNCFGGEAFTGAPRGDRRVAEQAAAEEVLKAFAKERQQLFHHPAKRRRKTDALRGGTGSGGAGASRGERAAAAKAKADPGAKARLHDVCCVLLGRPPQAGDVVYEVVPSNKGPTASLRLPGLQGNLGGRVWASDVCESRSDARIQVADLALRDLLEDAQYATLLEKQGSR